MKSKISVLIFVAVLAIALYFLLKIQVPTKAPEVTPPAPSPAAYAPKPLTGVPDSLKYPKATGKVSDMFNLLFNEADVDQNIFNGELKDVNSVSGDSQEIINVSQSYDENSI